MHVRNLIIFFPKCNFMRPLIVWEHTVLPQWCWQIHYTTFKYTKDNGWQMYEWYDNRKKHTRQNARTEFLWSVDDDNGDGVGENGSGRLPSL